MGWPFKLYRVSGPSMLPSLRPGNLVLGWQWFKPRPGQTVVVRRPDRSVIKRIKWVEGENVWIEGDNQNLSTDSRQFGLIPVADLSYKIIAKLS